MPKRPFRKDPATLGLIDAAYRLQKAGSLNQAELLYRRVLTAEPGNPFSLCALGTIALLRGEHVAAVAQLRQALAQGYTHEPVYTHLGVALQAVGADQEALELYRTAHQQDPKNPSYLSNISVVLAHQGRTEEALAAAQQALALNPRFAPACVNAGFHFQTLERFEEAAQMFERALLLDSGNDSVKAALVALRRTMPLGQP
jgi:Flp pilus assembly protein TadD